MRSDPTPFRTIAWATLRVNAFNASHAVNVAVECSRTWMFADHVAVSHAEAERMIQERTPSPPCWIGAGALPDKPGAWEVDMSMVTLHNPGGFVSRLNSRGLCAARHLESTPHMEPHGEDRPEHWAAARLAIVEKEVLGQTAQAPGHLPKTRHAL